MWSVGWAFSWIVRRTFVWSVGWVLLWVAGRVAWRITGWFRRRVPRILCRYRLLAARDDPVTQHRSGEQDGYDARYGYDERDE